MNIFSKKPFSAPTWRTLNGIRGQNLLWRRQLADRVSRAWARDQANASLWIPGAMGLGIAAYFALPVEPYPGWTLVLLGLAALLAWRCRSWGTPAMVLFAAFFCALGFSAAQLRTATVAAPALQERITGAVLSGKVLEASFNRQGGTTLIVAPASIGWTPAEEMPARVRLKVSQAHDPIWPGDHVEAKVLLWPPAGPVAPGAFDFARQAFFRQLGGTGVTISDPRVERAPGTRSWPAELAHLRERISRHIVGRMGPQAGPVATAMMTGQRHAIPEEVEQHLRDAGLAHILAISGLHMALFAGTLFWLVRAVLALVPGWALRYPLKKWAAVVALVGAFAYLLLSGMSVSTQRAFIMAALMFLAVLLDRPAFSLRNVALAAVIVLLLRPESLLEPGFQMSFAAATALVAVYQNRELQLLGQKEKAVGLWGLLRIAFIYVVTLAITSLVAGAATAPFAAFHFNRMAAYGIVGNLIAMPLVGMVIMPAALIAYLLMPLGLDTPALWVMEMGLEAVIAISETVSGWEGAVVHAPSFPVGALALIAFGGLWLSLWKTWIRHAGVLPIIAGLALAQAARPGDILIDGDAKLVAVRDLDGLYRWSGRSPRYARETWLRRSGFAAETPVGDRMMACDELGCVSRAVVRVAVARTSAALEQDCLRSEVLVALVPVRGHTRASCGAQLVIDRFDIAREEGFEVWLDPEDGSVEALRTVRSWRGERPWTGRQ